uniref:RNase NYN domain-containing protein n=1 Tax=uncultured Armatimonadetes bacterium TaxID=157466 RepID=A0A6J4H3J0_9BACT|nr:hypothetical protein AVDCRST_MAG63-41 [uncultured Armatimonadetes bacterium]
MSDDADSPAPSHVPADAAGWRTLLNSVPDRDLFRLVQKEKGRVARVFAGFRATAAGLRLPLVQNRLVEEALKQPAFANDLMEWEPSPPSPPAPKSPHPRHPRFARVPASPGAAEGKVGKGPTAAGEGETKEGDVHVAPTPSPMGATRASPSPADTAPGPTTDTPSPTGGTGAFGRGGRGVRAGTAPGAADAERLREKVNQQRARLREKDERVAALETALAEVHRERDVARADARAARTGQKAAEAQALRLRRQMERAERRAAAGTDGPSSPRPKASPPPPAAVSPPPPPAPGPAWDEALRRLLSRGKNDVVAEVCRQALAGGPEGGAGVVHALYAEALYGQGQEGQAAEHDRRAVAAYLDAGDVPAATGSFARALAHDGGGGEAAALLRRLLVLARRTGQEALVRTALGRLRVAAPAAHRAAGRLLAGLGEAPSDFFTVPAGPVVGPDESVTLPNGGEPVSPRQMVEAVESGEDILVRRVRDGIAALRADGGPLADALLKAVEALNPSAVVPLTRDTRPVVVDASNVARHDPDPLALSQQPHVTNLLAMRDVLLRRGYFPILMVADANLRFHVDDRDTYRSLVERGVVREALPGTTADTALIAEAKERRAPLVTNDRLWEWEDAEGIERIGFGIFGGRVTLTPF